MTLAFLDIFSGGEMTLILLAILLLFGGDKMPEFARGLAKVMREFRKAAGDVEREFKRAMEEGDEGEHPPKPTLRPAQAALPQNPFVPQVPPPKPQPTPEVPGDQPPPPRFEHPPEDPTHGLE